MYFTKSLALALSVITVITVLLISPGECRDKYDPKYGSRNITLGTRRYGDYMLYNQIVAKDRSFWRVISTDVIYPPKDKPRSIKITYVQVLDKIGKDDGGYAFHTSGGVGLGFVGFHLKSKRNHGYNFTVVIYGYEY